MHAAFEPSVPHTMGEFDFSVHSMLCIVCAFHRPGACSHLPAVAMLACHQVFEVGWRSAHPRHSTNLKFLVRSSPLTALYHLGVGVVCIWHLFGLQLLPVYALHLACAWPSSVLVLQQSPACCLPACTFQ
jgi:hypothetical protein